MARQELVLVSWSSLISGFEQTTPKDAWDKAEIVGTIAATIAVALIAGCFTWLYNRQQQRFEERRRTEDAARIEARDAEAHRESKAAQQREEAARAEQSRLQESALHIQRVQVIQTLLPVLKSSHEQDRRAALLAVQALGDQGFAVDLARIYGGPAGVSALTSLSADDAADDRNEVRAALSGLTQRLRHSVARVDSRGQDGGIRALGSGFCPRPGFLLTARHVVGTSPYGPSASTSTEGVLQVGTNEYGWQLSQASDDHGLALLETEAPLVPLTLAANDPGIDQDVLVVGWHHVHGTWVARPGMVLGPPQPEGTALWVTPAEIGSVGGFGGAPVVNNSLEVVAVHYKKYRDVGQRPDVDAVGLAHMISLRTIRAFLDRHALG